eukprot:CAMPEP_0117656594 /NCGR_PEP_ID=MMETSP0804-20121206/4887_1 /TAXON_ID=1074897 /ORGANISM="Tetraselmis astigmatica, Strain CCMP880" /LENGTH=115 /DNA_ID=CAMNT_0005463005 /DNA_START=410 /DNA_END=757 /DNA_ORIENTATION=+
MPSSVGSTIVVRRAPLIWMPAARILSKSCLFAAAYVSCEVLSSVLTLSLVLSAQPKMLWWAMPPPASGVTFVISTVVPSFFHSLDIAPRLLVAGIRFSTESVQIGVSVLGGLVAP